MLAKHSRQPAAALAGATPLPPGAACKRLAREPQGASCMTIKRASLRWANPRARQVASQALVALKRAPFSSQAKLKVKVEISVTLAEAVIESFAAAQESVA